MGNNEKKVGRNLLLTLLRMILLYTYIVIVRRTMPIYPNAAYMLIQTLFLMSMIYYIQLLVHELGHFIFGKLTGYELILFRIGSMVFINNNGNIEFKRYAAENTGGQCLMSPREELENNYFVLYNLGGIILNLIVSFVAIFIYLGIDGKGVFKSALIGISLFGIYLAIINGIPMTIKDGANDGYNVRLLFKDRLFKKAYYNQLKINKKIVDGVKFKEMPSELFEIEESSGEYNHLLLSIDILSMKRFMDKGLYTEARQNIYRILKKSKNLNSVQKDIFNGELLFLDMLIDRDDAEIKNIYGEKIEKYKEIAKGNISMNRILYGYELIINNNYKKSDEYLKRLNIIFKTYPFNAEIYLEKDLMKKINKLYITKLENKYNS